MQLPQGTDIFCLSDKFIKCFHEDISRLRCLTPSHEPRATGEIDVMITLICKLIERGNAYVKNGSVYFSVSSCRDYGKLSGRKIDELFPGNRVSVDTDKLHPGDFLCCETCH